VLRRAQRRIRGWCVHPEAVLIPRPTIPPPAPPERRRLNRIRSRLMRALRHEQPARLRAACVELASDIEAMVAGLPVADEACPSTARSRSGADTLPCPPPTFEIDVDLESAPPVPLARPSGGP
jgi:hypothetical protein